MNLTVGSARRDRAEAAKRRLRLSAFLKHTGAKLRRTSRGAWTSQLAPLLKGNGGSALGQKRRPLAAVPNAGWGGSPAAGMFRAFR